MRIFSKLILILAILAIVLLAVSAYQQGNIDPKVTVRENMDYIKIDKPSVDFELEDLNGNKVKLSDYKGSWYF